MRIGPGRVGLLLSAGLLMAQGNLITNPGFENGISAGGTAMNWNNNTFGTSVVAFSIDSLTPHLGRYAQKISCSSLTDGYVQLTNTVGFTVLKSRAYQTSVWLKGNMAGQVTLQLRRWGSPYTSYCARSFTITAEWREYSLTDFSIGTDGDARLFVFFTAPGTLYVDDAFCRMSPTSFIPPSTVIPEALFGMHMHRAWSNTPWPNASFKIWRLWDAYATWIDLEPVKGAWNFSKLDIYFTLASSHNVDLIVPLANSPTWASARPTERGLYGPPGTSAEPADSNDWKHYVRTVGEYCRNNSNGKARYFEIWNEPAFDTGGFFSGTQEKLVELSKQAYLILKQIDPSYTVISSSIVGNPENFDSFHGKGAKDWCDIVGYHFYTATPEKALVEIGRIKQSMLKNGIAGKPLWNTETGWWIRSETYPQGITLKDAGDYILRNYILNWASGIGAYCFYAWDNTVMGALDTGVAGTERPYLAQGYRTAYNWLAGSVMTSCSLDSATATWTVDLVRGGTLQKIVWNPDTAADFSLLSGWGFTTLQTISGAESGISGTSITVNSSPVLLKGPPSFVEQSPGPAGSTVLSACPNPGNPAVRITAALPANSGAEFRLYDIRGMLIWKMVLNAEKKAGKKRIIWNGENFSRRTLSSGLYIGCLMAGNRELARQKIMMIK